MEGERGERWRWWEGLAGLLGSETAALSLQLALIPPSALFSLGMDHYICVSPPPTPRTPPRPYRSGPRQGHGAGVAAPPLGRLPVLLVGPLEDLLHVGDLVLAHGRHVHVPPGRQRRGHGDRESQLVRPWLDVETPPPTPSRTQKFKVTEHPLRWGLPCWLSIWVLSEGARGAAEVQPGSQRGRISPPFTLLNEETKQRLQSRFSLLLGSRGTLRERKAVALVPLVSLVPLVTPPLPL